MAYNDEDEDDGIECEIIESYGIFSKGNRFWNKEVNLVSWNRRPAKIDIRAWQRNHAKCGRGITLSREEAEELIKLLGEILRKKPKAERTGKRRSQKPPVPEGLESFYRELKLSFGAGPEECKTARNTLLKKYHPDQYTRSTAFATRKTIIIKDAYEKIIEWWKANGLV